MDSKVLIDNIVRQTTILIAQLATSAGLRAPLAHIANQVFYNLVKEIEAQGVSRKVAADMFGMALRSYQVKVARLSESVTDRNRTLWEAVLEYLRSRGEMVPRTDILDRFSRDEEAVLRGILHDLVESGLALGSGRGARACYRAASEEEIGAALGEAGPGGRAAMLWIEVYKHGPISQAALVERIGMATDEADEALTRGALVGEPAIREAASLAIARIEAGQTDPRHGELSVADDPGGLSSATEDGA